MSLIPILILLCNTLAALQVAAVEQMKVSPRGWRAAMEAESALGEDRTSQASSLNTANVMSQSACLPSPPLLLLGPYTTWLIGGMAFSLGLLVGYIWHRLSTKKQLEIDINNRLKNENTISAPPQKSEVEEEAKALLEEKGKPPAVPLEEAYEIIETVETSCTTNNPSIKEAVNATTITTATALSSKTTTALSSLTGGTLANNNSELTVPTGENNASTSSDALVMAVARKLSSLDFNQMSIKEQLLALELMLRVDHTQHAKRLGTEANKIQSERLDIAKHTAAHTIAKDAVALARERTEEFKKTCSDSMITGVVVMAIFGGYQAWQRGVFTPLFHRCGSLPRASWGPFGLWGAWRSAEIAVCYTSGVSDTLLGIFVLVAVPWVVYRTGLLNDYHKLPIAKVCIGLGLVCGTAGHVAISKVGGDGWTWFVLWQFWTLLHVIMSTTAFRLCQRDVAIALQQIGDGSTSPEKLFQLHSNGSGGKVAWIATGLWLLSGFVLPILMSTLPFTVTPTI